MKMNRLPPGKTCADCRYFKRCEALFECNPTNTACDWDPSRFSSPYTSKEAIELINCGPAGSPMRINTLKSLAGAE